MDINCKSLALKICNYVNFLSSEFSLNLSIHLRNEYMAIHIDYLHDLNKHCNPYCMYVKSQRNLYERCLKCQKYVLQKCQHNESFIGTCHAGVKEIIYTITQTEQPVGFISISGYKTDRTLFPSYSIYLDKDSPSSELCDILIPPLVIMLETLCHAWASQRTYSLNDNSANQLFYTELLFYITDHYKHLTLQELALTFHRSKSTISHLFKSYNGSTLKSYCNILKINDAITLLKSSNLSITDIAYTTGFESLSYFITVFKKQTGYSPSDYRKHFQ